MLNDLTHYSLQTTDIHILWWFNCIVRHQQRMKFYCYYTLKHLYSSRSECSQGHIHAHYTIRHFVHDWIPVCMGQD